MSHTDKTDPFYVKLWDPHSNIRRVEFHDHCDGDCTLPATYREMVERDNDPVVTGCRWDFVYTGVNLCCCHLCRASGWLPSESRTSRRVQQRRNTDWRKYANAAASLADLDDVPLA